MYLKKRKKTNKNHPTLFSILILVTLHYFSSLVEDKEKEAEDLHFLPFLPSAPLLKEFTAFKSPVVSCLLELSFYIGSHISFCYVGMKCGGLLSTENIGHVIKECVYLNILPFFPPAQRPAACPSCTCIVKLTRFSSSTVCLKQLRGRE